MRSGSRASLGGFPKELVRGSMGKGQGRSPHRSSWEMCLVHHGPNYRNELTGKAWIHEDRGFEGVRAAIPLVGKGPSWPRLSTWLPERSCQAWPASPGLVPRGPAPSGWPPPAFIYQNFHGYLLCARLCAWHRVRQSQQSGKTRRIRPLPV